jgi:hypothetical protein
MHIELVDDGTLDTVFSYRGRQYRFDTEYVNDHGGVDQFLKHCGDRDIRDEWHETVPEEMRAAIKSIEHVGRHSESMDGWVDVYVAHIDDEQLYLMTGDADYIGGIYCEDLASVVIANKDQQLNRHLHRKRHILDVMYALECAVHCGHDNTTGHDCCGRTFSSPAEIIHVDGIYNRVTVQHTVQRNV